MKKKVIVTCGPIPSRVDSVKYITNRFKGGLSLNLAHFLAKDYDVEIVKWFGTYFETELPQTAVCDVYEYYETMKRMKADAYILGAAVANLTPTNPWDGKFPSHLYKEGDKFNIEFTIAPRTIDRIKDWHPHATLIGYKLFDGTQDELLDAAWETLTHSRSNVVFANHPKTAKEEKVAVMPDGTHIKMSFEEHTHFIKRVIELEWYRTMITKEGSVDEISSAILSSLMSRIAVQKDSFSFGTVAIRSDEGFFTTTRGKRDSGFCRVHGVDHVLRTVYASERATLNSPTLSLLFNRFSSTNVILHGHRQVESVETLPYSFSGTTEEVRLIRTLPEMNSPIFNVENHGYYACFRSVQEAKEWIDARYR